MKGIDVTPSLNLGTISCEGKHYHSRNKTCHSARCRDLGHLCVHQDEVCPTVYQPPHEEEIPCLECPVGAMHEEQPRDLQPHFRDRGQERAEAEVVGDAMVGSAVEEAGDAIKHTLVACHYQRRLARVVRHVTLISPHIPPIISMLQDCKDMQSSQPNVFLKIKFPNRYSRLILSPGPFTPSSPLGRYKREPRCWSGIWLYAVTFGLG